VIPLLLALLFGDRTEMIASWYGHPFQGRRTADGETFDLREATCASRTLPFGTLLLLERGDRAAVARVNDRGPWAVDSLGSLILPLQPHPSRDLDLSLFTFKSLALLVQGEISIRVTVIGRIEEGRLCE